MGLPEISQDAFRYESKTTLNSRASLHSLDDVTPNPAQESRLQLFQAESSYEEEQWRFDVRDWLVFICIVIIAMMDAFDATVMIPVLPELANMFDRPLVSTLWVNIAYLIPNAASQLFFTMMCDVFSHGVVWIIALVIGTIGTGICGGSMSLMELIIGRSIQGIGGGGAMALCFVIMAESAPESVQSRYSCYILLTRLIGSMLGPIVGGLFVDKADWTWAFYFNFIFCALGLLGIPFATDLRVSTNIPLRKLRTLDWSGATMALLGPGSILIGLSWGGISYKWTQWQTLMPIIVGVATLVAMTFYESMWALHPQFGTKVFRSTATTMTYIGCFCHGFVIFCQMQYFTIYLLSAKYMSTTVSGLALLCITGLALTPSAVVGIVLAREPQCSKYIISGGWVLTVLASGCSILLDAETPTVGWVFLFFTAGLGHGLLLSSYNIRIHSMPKDEGASLSTKPIMMFNFMGAWGMAVAIPIGGMVFLNCFGDKLHSIGLRRDLINTADGYLVLMNQVKMTDEQREAIQEASATALQAVWEVITGVGAIGGISSAFFWKERR
ncbi:uncharacterized protein N7482_007276 [Penicillium canariense]|uniref:Major facilitator superfamily (MFS) profile domain-containing protein n=1 Tax=Penicillium canariense TaxID=189055 RepID=A0A9W9HZE4_9EURO|nr:uncharacterized protein N7482_007276 [Penicillium canariense]KAJ5160272.1 hypothetical protein N7482_007276 [Penicillium canariense]